MMTYYRSLIQQLDGHAERVLDMAKVRCGEQTLGHAGSPIARTRVIVRVFGDGRRVLVYI